MAIEHDWTSKHLLHTRYVGTVSGEEMIKAALEVSGDARFDNLYGVIGDWSEATGTQVNADDVETLAAIVGAAAKSNPHITNISILPPSPARHYLVSNYNLLMANCPWETGAVHSFAEAVIQLELDPETFLKSVNQ